ncbi:redox-regulated ATPase YchF [Candidatus Woesearchaeota archaeon]|nr:redox-regulated ATPase YchF [Candidatus Woesearchaeota archaeon]
MIIGVVGKANVGKSTFFKAATLAEVEIANYPFATIKPNHGIGFVKVKSAANEFGKDPNPREGYYIDGWRFVPVNMIDVAGLVPGAHEGKGMGNQFLDDLRQAHVLVHVIDAAGTTNEKGEPVEPGSYDPANDVEFLEVELDMWYVGILKKGWEKFARTVQQEHLEIEKALAKQLSGLGVDEDMVKQAVADLKLDKDKPSSWSEDDLMRLATWLRKKTKPMIIACNKVDMPTGAANFNKLKQKFPELMMIPCSAETELALKEAAKHKLIKYVPGDSKFEVLDESKLNDKQKKAIEFMKKFLDTHKSTGVQDVLDKAVFELLKYKAIFPGGVGKLEDKDGNVLPDCFLMPEKATALDFAFRIHTDIGKRFVKAVNVRTRMPVGKEHILKHRDIVEIMTS